MREWSSESNTLSSLLAGDRRARRGRRGARRRREEEIAGELNLGLESGDSGSGRRRRTGAVAVSTGRRNAKTRGN